MEREAKLEELWNLTIEQLKSKIQEPDCAPAWATAAIKFLKENEIDVLPATGSGLEGREYPFKTGTVG